MNKVPENVVLMHLSQESNTKEKALEALESFFEFDGASFRNMHITVADQDNPSEFVYVGNTLSSNIKNKLLNNYPQIFNRKEAIG